MATWQRYVLGVACLVGWVFLIGVSIVANYKFASSIGQSPVEQYILGAGSVASDLFKSIAFVAFFWFASRKSWSAAIAVAVVGTVATVFSLVAATGFSAGTRYEALHKAEVEQRAVKDIEEDIKRSESNRDWQPVHKPLPVVEAELKKLEMDPLYAASGYCNFQKGPAQEKHCRSVAEANVALAAAKAAIEEDAKIKVARKELRGTSIDYSWAQVDFWTKRTGWKSETILSMLVALQVLLIEVGSAFGLTVALALLVPPDTKLGQVLSIVKPGRGKGPTVVVPDPKQVAAVAGGGRSAASFTEPAAGKPVGGGLRQFLKPYVPELHGPRPVSKSA